MKYRLPIGAFTLLIFLGFLPGKLVAQNDSLPEPSQVLVGLRYSSDYLFMGRSDSVKAPYLSASAEFAHRSGFFVNGSLSYLTAAQGRVDLVTLSAGYDYYGTSFSSGISLAEYFFSEQSYTVQSEMTTYLNAYAGYDFSVAALYADISAGFADNPDVFAGLEINRTFYLLQSRLRLTPLVMVNAGTQQYYSEYYSYRSSKTGMGPGKGKGGMPQSSPVDTYIGASDKFQLLDYEGGLRLTYRLGNWRLLSQAIWVFPVNPSTVTTSDGSYEEDLRNGFYWTVGVRMSLKAN